MPSAPDHPKGGNFYPEDMTKEEFEKFVAGLSDHEAKDAKGTTLQIIDNYFRRQIHFRI